MKNMFNDDFNIINNDEIDLKILWKVLKKNIRSLLYITGLIVFLMVVYLFFIATPLFYSNSTVFQIANDSNSSINKLSSIASVAGLNVGADESSASNVDLIDYISSRRLQNQIVGMNWKTKTNEIDLITHWGINDTTKLVYRLKTFVMSRIISNDKTEEEKKLKWTYTAMNKLKERIIAGYNDTGLLTVEVWMEDPLLTQKITDYIVDSIVKYTNAVKMESWSRTREFYIQRMGEVKVELEKTETTLTKFQKENRRIIDSPDLTIELLNLQRDVEIQTALYISLQNEYEIARIEETKDITEFKILDKAMYPLEIAKPQKRILLLISLLVGFIISIPSYLLFRSFRT